MNIKIRRGQLVGFLGKIGSGKSTLINALLGEAIALPKNDTHITIRGSMSYVSQKSWIQNETVRNNVLFGRPFNKKLYQATIHQSSMVSDLDIMQNGDLTQIGEKGANLSGGQRLRIALARALYAEKDIILLDDPLSPLDAHVGKFIFQDTIKQYLAHRTRILVTHALYFAKDLDYIYIFDGKRIAAEGTYEQICKLPVFTDLLIEKLDGEDEANHYQEILNDMNQVGMTEQLKESMHNLLNRSQNNSRRGSFANNAMNTSGHLDLPQSNNQSRNFRYTSQAMDQSNLSFYSCEENQWQSFNQTSFFLADKKDNVIAQYPEQKSLRKEERPPDEINPMASEGNDIIVKEYYNKYGEGVRKFYIQNLGGLPPIFLLGFIMLFWITFQVGTLYWIVYWVSLDKDVRTEHSEYWYLGIFYAGAICYAFVEGLRVIVLNRNNQRGQDRVFAKMTKNLFNAPINEFFERIPIGRILNRYSEDMTIADNMMPQVMEIYTLVILITIGLSLALIQVSRLWILPIMIVYFVYYKILVDMYSISNRSLILIERDAKSKALSSFAEILQGLPIIRCFDA